MNCIGPIHSERKRLNPGLWSLSDMLRVYATYYMNMSAQIADMQVYFALHDEKEPPTEEQENSFRDQMKRLLKLCEQLDLQTARTLIESRIKTLPKSEGEFDLLIETIYAELKNKLFVFVPPHRSKFYDYADIVSPRCKAHFPGASAELHTAGNCYALAQYTAAVFHSMRGMEIGLRSLAAWLEVEFPFPLQLAEWANMIDKIESKIRDKKDMPKGLQKDEDVKFCAEAAAQFRYFKDAWRIRVSHARETYDEHQALGVIEHSRSFLEILAGRMVEPGVLIDPAAPWLNSSTPMPRPYI